MRSRRTATNGSGGGSGGVSPSSPAFLVTIDTVAPTVLSVNRENPTAASTSAAIVTFRVRLSESVGGVDAADFTPVFTRRIERRGVGGVIVRRRDH